MKTYGTAELSRDKKEWRLSVEPHVAVRLKRVFAQIDGYAYGTLRLSATDENCRELEWFITRFPLVVDPLEALQERSSRYKERATVLDALKAGQYTPCPVDLKIPLRHYQEEALRTWMTTKGLLLADDLGLGKTAVAIAGISQPELRPALVVVQSNLPDQWVYEIGKFTDLTIHKLKKSTPYDITTDGKLPDVVLSNYHKIHGWVETLAPVVKSLVVDECQELRRRESQKYSALRHLAAKVDHRLGLSATPVFNYGGEIWNILDVLQPDSLGTWQEFQREWCSHSYGDKPKLKDARAFGVYVRDEGLMLRRTRKDVGDEMPKITSVVHHVDANTEELDKIKGKAVELAKLIMQQGQDFKGQKFTAAGQFDLALRQATGIAKAPYVAEFVKLLFENGVEKILLLAWHRAVHDIFMEQLAEFNPVLYTGTETPAMKEKSKQDFIAGDARILIMSLGSGAGLNGLQDVCDIAVFGELAWSGEVHNQIIGRLNRNKSDGSACDPVTAYYLVSDYGADPIMVDILGLKREQSEGIRDPDSPLVTKVEADPDHLKKLAEEYLKKYGEKP